MCVLSYKYKESTHFDFCLVKRVQRITVLRYMSVTPLVMDQNGQNIVLINTQDCLAYLDFDAIFEFLGQFTIRCNIVFQKGVDNFEIERKTC